jgi:hypothetical protein
MNRKFYPFWFCLVTKEKSVSDPVLHEYSNSASVGKRYTRPEAFSSGISDSRLQNYTASSHDSHTLSPRKDSYEKKA